MARLLVAMMSLVATLPAQEGIAAIGAPAPPLALRTWVSGPPADLAAARERAIVLLAVASCEQPWSRAEARILSRAAQRFSGALVACGVAVQDAEPARALVAGLGRDLRIPVAADPGGAGLGPLAATRCTLLDREGRIVWRGPIDSDLDDAIDDLVHDRFDARFAALAEQHANALADARERRDPARLVAAAEPLVERFPQRALGWTATFQAWHVYANDEARAHATALRALRALADDPRQLAAFAADSDIAAGALGDELREALLEPLQKAFEIAPEHRKVLEARFEVLARGDRTAAAADAAARLIERLKHDTARLVAFADRLSTFGTRFGHLALLATELAGHARPEDRGLLDQRFWIMVRCTTDTQGAALFGDKLLAEYRHDASRLNEFAWDLLTEPEAKGRFAELALRAAEAMTKIPAWENHWRLDTLALARFENGDLDGAIDTQRKACALATGSSTRERYRTRLASYEAARRGERDKRD
jgi:hypothetical protein